MRSVQTKFLAATVSVVLLTLGIVAALDWRQAQAQVVARVSSKLTAGAASGVLSIDGAQHQLINGPCTQFGHLRQELSAIQHAVNVEEYDILTLRARPDHALEFVGSLRTTDLIGTPYDPPPAVRTVIDEVLRDGVARATPLYSDQFGTFVSAFAAVRATHDPASAIVAILEIDSDVERLLSEAHRLFWQRLAWLSLSLLIAIAVSLAVARAVSRRVRRLVTGVDAVARGDYDQAIAVESSDELGMLARAFNDMLASLRERFSLLRFVPRHTRALIQDAARDNDSTDAALAPQTRDVAVFFSDIRGFTTLADQLPADRIMAMLNIYLRKEAEIIEAEGGSIDKFIGDAVMAIFQGPDRFAAATRAAVRIQQAMAKLNRENAFDAPVEVGIGIGGGEVKLGLVGYEDRLEFAVIGRLVNLASRLCSKAGAGEVLVSDTAWAQLGGAFNGRRLEQLKLKGFAGPIDCFVILPDGESPSALPEA